MLIIKCLDSANNWVYLEAKSVSVSSNPNIEAFQSKEYIQGEIKLNPDYIFVKESVNVNPVMVKLLQFENSLGEWFTLLFNTKCYLLSDSGKTIDCLM